MTIQAVTTWQGTPAGLMLLAEGSKLSAPVHESFGAKNPKLGRASVGGDVEQAHYSIEFDNQEGYGKFMDLMLASEWWSGTQQWMEDNKEAITNLGTAVYYSAI